jgi:hypothetical protein
MTAQGLGSRRAIFSVIAIIRPYEERTMSAPCSCASRATVNAIDASVSTPVIRSFLPSKIPMIHFSFSSILVSCFILPAWLLIWA